MNWKLSTLSIYEVSGVLETLGMPLDKNRFFFVLKHNISYMDSPNEISWSSIALHPLTFSVVNDSGMQYGDEQ